VKKLIIFLIALGPIVFPQNSVGSFADQVDVGKSASHRSRDVWRRQRRIHNRRRGSQHMGQSRWISFRLAELKGNFILTTNAAFAGKGVEPHRKIGWMVRSSLADDSPHASAVVAWRQADRVCQQFRSVL